MDASSSEPGLERTLRALASAARSQASGSEERAAIALAARALLYLRSREGLEGFRDWLESSGAEASPEVPIRAFDTLASALAWLEERPEPAGSFVEVEHETYVIALGPTGSFVLVRTMTQHAPVAG